ncbi:hypothetical protein DIS18_08755 [Algibacter marinivivus]|uniref:Uncharacterized protein n=2 Tax=Algibacter marinivivus TaxID=2100723 RepID=A0A2U2X3H0_9FLAO|nr:hypothetical protein DIS18_08755 [Algibacter marinivivus]
MKSELNKAQIEVSNNESGREGVDFLIGNKQIFFQPLDLDTILQSFKILKHELGELNDNLFIALVLIIEKQPRVVYIIPSKELQDSDNNFFINNDVSLMPSLSNWEIKISSTTIVELEKYALNNMLDKL